MRALILEQPGRPPSLALRDIPAPSPAPTEALVRVAACGFCHHDLLVMAGVLRRGVKPGLILGHEIAGVVAEVGAAVRTLRPGDQVVSIQTDACGECDRCRQGREHRCRHGAGIGHGRDGGFAEYVAVAQSSLVKIPSDPPVARGEGGDFLVGAALFGCPMGVALQAAQQVAQLRSGETVLITGAGGGLGVHAVQIGAHLGARVLAVTSSPEKAAALRQLGAAEVLEIPSLTPVPTGRDGGEALDFSELARALTGDEGVEVVLDTVGSPLFPSTWRSLAQYGRLVLLGEVAGRPVELNLAEVIFRDARILGSSGVSRSVLQQVPPLVSQGRLKPVVSRVLPLQEAPLAFDLLASRSVLGRVVLIP